MIALKLSIKCVAFLISIFCGLLAPSLSASEKVYSHTAEIATAPGNRHFLWQSCAANGSIVFLLGSLHFGNQSMYPLPDIIMESFARSDAVVVEADISETDITRGLDVMMQGLYQNGSTLKDHLSPSTWQRLVEKTEQLGLPLNMIALQKPWAAMLTFSAISMAKSGLSSEYGIEQYFLEKANQLEKPVLELESVNQQLNLLQSLDPEAQEYLLNATLSEMDSASESLEAILVAWKNGDSASMNQLILQNEALPDAVSTRIHHALFTERNHNMAKKIVALMKSGETYFVIVGAGHLLGDSGLIHLLKHEGFTFVQL